MLRSIRPIRPLSPRHRSEWDDPGDGDDDLPVTFGQRLALVVVGACLPPVVSGIVSWLRERDRRAHAERHPHLYRDATSELVDAVEGDES